MTLDEIIEIVERDLPDFDWIIRSDAQGGFANILSKKNSVPVVTPRGTMIRKDDLYFPQWAETPKQALRLSYLAAMVHLNRPLSGPRPEGT